MTLNAEDVPSAAVPPDAPQPSEVWEPVTRWSRRRVLGIVAGATVASGMMMLGVFPWSKPQAAFAGAYQAWPDCHGFFDSSTVCVPNTALYSNNCSGTWHRNDGGSGTCYNYRYWHYASSCAGNNAWKWYGRVANRKCSDGWYEYNTCGGTHISRFSICRTAL